MDIEIYLSLKEDVMSELIEKYDLSLETTKAVLQVNQFKERFMSNDKQFDCIEVEELAEEFYKTYEHLSK